MCVPTHSFFTNVQKAACFIVSLLPLTSYDETLRYFLPQCSKGTDFCITNDTISTRIFELDGKILVVIYIRTFDTLYVAPH